MSNTLTGVITTDLAATRTVTIASGSGAVGFIITDPVSGTTTTVTVTWASDDTTTATALAAKVNDTTQATYLSYLSATSAIGVVTLTYAGVVGATANLAATGTGVTVNGNLGIYADGGLITVTAAFDNEYGVPLTVSAVQNLTDYLTSMVDDSALVLVGLVLPATTTTTVVFPCRIRTGQTVTLTPTISYGLICGTTISNSTTGAKVSVAVPSLVGGLFPSETN